MTGGAPRDSPAVKGVFLISSCVIHDWVLVQHKGSMIWINVPVLW